MIQIFLSLILISIFSHKVEAKIKPCKDKDTCINIIQKKNGFDIYAINDLRVPAVIYVDANSNNLKSSEKFPIIRNLKANSKAK